jgi:hypothetical protein
MPINATVTAKSGPNQSNTAAVFTGATGMLVLPDRKIVQLFIGGDTNSPPAREFDMNGVTTFTITISGTTYTVVIS